MKEKIFLYYSLFGNQIEIPPGFKKMLDKYGLVLRISSEEEKRDG